MGNDELKAAGFKMTSPRLKILSVLEEQPHRHLSAEEVYKTLLEREETMSLATIYRTLTQFHEAGLVKRHHFHEDRSVFELTQAEHHDHLICIHCGQVQEFVDLNIEKQQEAIAQAAGFKITDHELNLYGICPACQKLGKNP